MLRSVLLYLSTAAWARQMVTQWSLARRVARRFVAGETLAEAVEVVRALNKDGLLATIDYLGESVARAEDTREVVEMYRLILEDIHHFQLKADISLKLTHLGLELSEELCQNNLRRILTTAKEHGIPVQIDMEGSALTETTLTIYRTMRDKHDFSNVGTVIQSYLYRSAEDMRQLAAEGAHIRIVKGAYREPPEVAFPQKADVDKNFVALMETFLSAPPPAYLCIATHDESMIEAAKRIIQQRSVPPERYEYQMLYGIRSDRQRELVKAGDKVRLYVPFGEAWYPYFMRRLAERPANLWFFMRSLFRR